MKIIFQLIILMFVTSFAFGQREKKEAMVDTICLTKWETKLIHELELKSVIKSTNTFHFRYWKFGQVVDIVVTPDSIMEGQITCFAIESIEDIREKKIKPKIFSNKLQIEKLVANQTLDLIHKTKINNLPTDTSIAGWDLYEDSGLCDIELFNNGNYTYKSYCSPFDQDSLKESLIVRNFVTLFEELLDLKKKYNIFFDKLPKGCYEDGSNILTCKED